MVKLNADEAAELDLRARAMRCSRQQVLVSAAFSHGEVFERVLQAQQRTAAIDARKTLRVLVGVATNLNQLTQRLHASDGTINLGELHETVQQVQVCVARIQAELDEGQL